MQKWEHCLLFQYNNNWRAVYYNASGTFIFAETPSFEETMQKMTDGGWELVTVYNYVATTDMYWAFKRPSP
jgi:hypothetical protein